MSGLARKKICSALRPHREASQSLASQRVLGTYASVLVFVKSGKKGDVLATITVATSVDVIVSGSTRNTIANLDHVCPVNLSDRVRPIQSKLLFDINSVETTAELVSTLAIPLFNQGYTFEGMFNTDLTAEQDLADMDVPIVV